MEATADGPVVLGSAALPWPVPGCQCPACLAAPHVRRSVSGLLLGVVQLDGDPAPGGPQGVTAPGSGGRVRVTSSGAGALAPGEGVEVGPGVRVVALPAGTADGEVDPARAVLVAAELGRTVLWAPDTGLLPAPTLDALAGAHLQVAALDVRGSGGEPDPRRLAHQLARLRAVDALAPSAAVVAVGLSHDAPPEPLARRLASWGAQLVADGATLQPGAPLPRPPRRTLVLGASGSGKSALAEDLLAAEPAVVYAATGPVAGPDDVEWAARVHAHRERRPPWWHTVETTQLATLLTEPGPALLVDSLGTWTAAVLGRCGAWDDADPASDGWEASWQQEVARVVAAWRQARRPVVAVAEDVGGGLVAVTSTGRRFQRALGGLTQRLAEGSERVLLVVAGRPLDLPGGAAPGHD